MRTERKRKGWERRRNKKARERRKKSRSAEVRCLDFLKLKVSSQ